MGFVGELVTQVLNDREVGPMAFEGFETVGQGVLASGLFYVGEPRFFGDAPAEAEEEEPFDGSRGCVGGEWTKAERFEDGECDERGSAAEEGASEEGHTGVTA